MTTAGLAGQLVPDDSLRVRQPDAEELSDYLAAKKFDYGEDVIEQESFLDRLLRSIVELISAAQQALGPVWTYLIWGVLAVITIFAILRVLGADFTSAVYGKRPDSPGVGSIRTAVSGPDFVDELRGAEARGDVRGALRWQYLLLLRALDERGVIKSRPEATNWMYVAEISDAETRDFFSQITAAYERAWYGDRVPEQTTYDLLAAQMGKFTRST